VGFSVSTRRAATNSIAAERFAPKIASRLGPHRARTRCFGFIKAHLYRLSHLTRSPVHGGAGGTGSDAMSNIISWNIFRNAATRELGPSGTCRSGRGCQ
jgi:hypothetical protein